MRLWASLVTLAIGSVAPRTAWTQTAAAPVRPPFSAPWFARVLAGAGSVPALPDDDRTGNIVFTAEIGHQPVGGAQGGVLATGFSISSTEDAKSHWSVVTPGLFAQIDLTYLLLSGIWSQDPPSSFPVRLNLGSRLGLGISESFRPSQDLPYAQPFKLYRPELMSYLQVDFPLGGRHEYVVLARGAIDTSVNLGETLRWSVSSGIAYCWGMP